MFVCGLLGWPSGLGDATVSMVSRPPLLPMVVLARPTLPEAGRVTSTSTSGLLGQHAPQSAFRRHSRRRRMGSAVVAVAVLLIAGAGRLSAELDLGTARLAAQLCSLVRLVCRAPG